MLFGVVLVIASVAAAQAADDQGIGDYRYSSLPSALKCRTTGGNTAACAGQDHGRSGGGDVDARDETVSEQQSEKGPWCGNGMCEAAAGEDSVSCANDCGGSVPGGVGPERSEYCEPQTIAYQFAVRGSTSAATCSVDGAVGADQPGGRMIFGQVVTITEQPSQSSNSARVIMGSGACGGGYQLDASVEFRCENGIIQPRSANCGCCKIVGGVQRCQGDQ
jgi:hypothetical protein